MTFQQAILNMFGGLPPMCITFPLHADITVVDLKDAVEARVPIPTSEMRFATLGGRPLLDDHRIFEGDEPFVALNLKLGIAGGKGGFGSMLRAQGGKMASQKTTNFEACRDLNGRRLRTVNEAKKLADYLEKEPERRRLKEEKRRKKIEEGLREPPIKRIRFNDPKYLQDSEDMVEDARAAVAEAIKLKRPLLSKMGQNERATAFTMWDDDVSSDESTDHDDHTSSSDVDMTNSDDDVPSDEGESSTDEKAYKGKGKADNLKRKRDASESESEDDDDD